MPACLFDVAKRRGDERRAYIDRGVNVDAAGSDAGICRLSQKFTDIVNMKFRGVI